MFKKIQIALFFFFITSSLHADIIRRAALDIGSGETKLTIADVDTESHKIVRPLFKDSKIVELRRDLASSHDGNLSIEIQDQLYTTLNNFIISTKNLAPTEWVGIGTSVFRKARNGEEVLYRIKESLGISIDLVAQEEEGELGFRTAVAASGLDENEVISWDSGGGSFQITTLDEGQLMMYGAEFAMVPAMELLAKEIRCQEFQPLESPNPISLEEAKKLIFLIENKKLPLIPDWLRETDKKVVRIGGESSIFYTAQKITGKKNLTQEDVWNALVTISGKEDQELQMFRKPSEVVVGLSLFYAIMTHCGIEEVHCAETNGLCEGLLVLEKYWDPALTNR